MKRFFNNLILIIFVYSFTGAAINYNISINKLILPSLNLQNKSDDKDTSGISSDGPYVLYRDGSIIVKSVLSNDSGYTISEESFEIKDEIELICRFEKEKSFKFKLQKSLEIQPAEYSLPDKILAVSDIEGNIKAFKSILEGSGVIDENNSWIFGRGHLVLIGDFFDRGLNVTETLWLIYKLESEAVLSGGKVHFILGNHEIMNLYGNKKYVRNKYIENCAMLNESYNNLFSNDTELGRWLRTKNIIEKIGSYVFVHGGISKDLANFNLTFEEINRIARQNIGKRTDSIDTETGRLINSSALGPFWYRGLVNGELTQEEVNSIMLYANAEKIIVGHTIVENITAFYENKILAIDLDHAENIKENKMYALWIEDGRFYIIDNNGKKEELN